VSDRNERKRHHVVGQLKQFLEVRHSVGFRINAEPCGAEFERFGSEQNVLRRGGAAENA